MNLTGTIDRRIAARLLIEVRRVGFRRWAALNEAAKLAYSREQWARRNGSPLYADALHRVRVALRPLVSAAWKRQRAAA